MQKEKHKQANKQISYVLATGGEGAHRLRIVHEVHGEDTLRFLERAGLAAGMRVAEFGCGTGMITREIARQVGASASVVGIDISPEQIGTARELSARPEYTGIEYRTASAYETGLEESSFDFVYSRFMLMHIQFPEQALAEMHRVLKPRGALAVEDGDFDSPFCDPPSAAFDRCFDLYRQMGSRENANFDIGRRLASLVRAQNFCVRSVSLAQPVVVGGEAKRLPEWTLEEIAAGVLEAGLASKAEMAALTTEMQRLASDETVVFAMARVMQVAAVK